MESTVSYSHSNNCNCIHFIKTFCQWLTAKELPALPTGRITASNIVKNQSCFISHAVKQHIRHQITSKAARWTCVELHSPLDARRKLSEHLNSQHRTWICKAKMSQKGTGLGIRKLKVSQPYRWRLVVAQSISSDDLPFSPALQGHLRTLCPVLSTAWPPLSIGVGHSKIHVRAGNRMFLLDMWIRNCSTRNLRKRLKLSKNPKKKATKVT